MGDELINSLIEDFKVGTEEKPPLPIKGNTSVFNNSYADMALQKMSPEERAKYARIGAKMYGNYSYETAGLQGIGSKPESGNGDKVEPVTNQTESGDSTESGNKQNTPKEDIVGENLTEATAYILEGIKAGLHPYDLEQNEKDTLRLQLGALWMERFGYTLEDVERPPKFRK